ncbi:uncharacterized protein [Pempheris klunzingeri]|uniref:uncharacterized protein n=1 Tax=Pempheris klunzingeri TaxID=3127111 RepID=UPI00397F8774
MQPVETRKGVSTKSQLFHSLKVYLNNENRLQPIIGLGSIIECVKASTHNREAFYLCEVCVCRHSKADMRNHIMGSIHRYNYIKAWHPHLVSEWKENSDLSKLAWPLMDIAKTLEGKEGPGDVQLLEVGDAVFLTMATLCEKDAVTLINILRNGQRQVEPEIGSETTSMPLEHCPTQSQRIVLLTKSQQIWSEKSLKTSAETNKPPSPIQSAIAPFVKSDSWLQKASMSPWDNTQMPHELSVLSENSSSFLDGYTGTKPLIGLLHVVECRSEDGHTYCFLCHCCRIRSNKKDIIDHLTSSSHLVNYLMETHPEQLGLMMTDINNNFEHLQSLAQKVEQEEGRGELKVVNAPESLCILLTGKSYHWCIKMLWNGGTHTNTQKRKIAAKGPSVSKTSNQGVQEKCGVALSKWEKRKKKKANNIVFKVSLPIAKGSVLLARTSFNMDRIPVSLAYSPPSAPESQSEDCELDCETVDHAEHNSLCVTSQLQQDVYGGDADAGQHMRPATNVTQYQELDGYFSDYQYFNQSKDITGTNDQTFYGGKIDNRQHGSQETSAETFYEGWQNEYPETQNEWLSPAVCDTQDWSSYYSSYRCEVAYTEQWYNSAQFNTEERQREMSSDATQHYYQQQPQNQYIGTRPYESCDSQCGAAWFAGELTPHLDAARINMQPHLGDPLAYCGSTAPEPCAF